MRHKEIKWLVQGHTGKKDRPGKLSPEPLDLTTREYYHLKQREETRSGCLDFLAKYKSSVMQSNRSNIVLLIHSLCYNLYTMARGNQEHIRWGLLPGSLRFITYIWWWCVWNIPPHVYFLSEIVSFSNVCVQLFISLAYPLLTALWSSVNWFGWTAWILAMMLGGHNHYN